MRRLRFVDLTTLTYLAVVTVWLLVFRDGCSPHWRWWLALHGILAGGVVALTSRPGPRFLETVRDLYPLPLFVLFYRESEVLNRGLFTEPLDPLFFQIEQSLFGTQPSIAFAQSLPQTSFAELLYAGYFSFYLMNIGAAVGWVLRNPPKARRFLGTLASIFYLCDITFMILPVVGPRILDLDMLAPSMVASLGLADVGPMPASTQAGPFAIVMRYIYMWFEGAGAAFPSSHVMVALLILREAFRQRLRFRWGLAGLVFLLCLGTVYGRYHYVVDVLGALVIGPPLFVLVEYLQQRMEPEEGLTTDQRSRS
ncbi:MAG: phosphatase PAP2 family protein [Limisphaerales bacterium]